MDQGDRDEPVGKTTGSVDEGHAPSGEHRSPLQALDNGVSPTITSESSNGWGDPDQCQKMNPIGSRILTLVMMRTGVISAVGTVMLSCTGALNRRGAETKSRLAWSAMMVNSDSTP